jgi:two-component system, cell cycle response regulator
MVPEDDDFDESSETTVVFDRRDLMDGVSPSVGRSHVLVRMDGSDVGQVTTLTGTDIELGRLAQCQIHLPFEGVSRKHALISWSAGSYFVEDVGSANGTFVQGTRLTGREELSDGNVIQLGPRVVFRYSVTDTGEEKILRQLYESSVKDSLTGAYNREYFGERLKSEVAYSIRHQTELSLVILDLDHFKKVNDTHGHQGGDAVLIAAVAALSRTLRAEDVVARYGGEEFAVILRGIALGPATTVGERLRGLVEAMRVNHGEEVIRATLSAGCASLACCAAPGGDALVAVADRRLYIAKRGGRNRVVAVG